MYVYPLSVIAKSGKVFPIESLCKTIPVVDEFDPIKAADLLFVGPDAALFDGCSFHL